MGGIGLFLLKLSGSGSFSIRMVRRGMFLSKNGWEWVVFLQELGKSGSFLLKNG